MRTPSTRRRLAAGSIAIVAVAAATAVATAPAQPVAGPSAAALKITARGVGPIRLGATATSLQQQGLIGKLTPGCELGGPDTRGARVMAFDGNVGMTTTSPRRVNVVTVTKAGPAARGVEVGDTTADIRKAFPDARVDRSMRDMFGGDFVNVPKRAGGRIAFFVEADSGKISMIGVPAIPVCE